MNQNRLIGAIFLIVFNSSCGVKFYKDKDVSGSPDKHIVKNSRLASIEFSPLMVSVSKTNNQKVLTNDNILLFDIVFERPIDPDTFKDASNVSISGDASFSSLVFVDGQHFILTLIANSNTSVSVSIPADTAGDFSGILNTAALPSETIVVDLIPPLVSISKSPSQNLLTNDRTITFIVAFDKDIDPETFNSSSDIQINGTADFGSINKLDDRNFIVTLQNADGDVSAQIPADVASDMAGNSNPPSPTVSEIITVDFVSPTVTIVRGPSQSNPAATLPLNFTIMFSEPIDPTSFDIADINYFLPSVTPASAMLTNTGDNQTYTFTVTDVERGDITPNIDAGLVQDPAGNNSVSSTNDTVFYETQLLVTVNKTSGQLDPAPSSENEISFDIDFNRPINNSTFDLSDLNFLVTMPAPTVWELSTLDNTHYNLSAIDEVKRFRNNDVNKTPAIYSKPGPFLYDGSLATFVGQNSDFPHDPMLELNEGSVSLSFKTNNADIQQTLLSKDALNYVTGGHLGVYLTGGYLTGRIQFGTGSVGTSYRLFGVHNKIVAGTWYHLIVKFGSYGFKLYLDGKKIASDAYVGSLGTNSNTSSGAGNQESLMIGASQSARPSGDNSTAHLTSFFDGEIKDIEFYNKYLSSLEEGSLQPSLVAGKVQDSDLIDNQSSTSTDNLVQVQDSGIFYSEPVMVAINKRYAQADPAVVNNDVFFNVAFSRPIDPSSFDLFDITDLGNIGFVTWSLTPEGDNIHYTLTASDVTAPGFLEPTITAGSIIDVPGLSTNTDSISADNIVTINAF